MKIIPRPYQEKAIGLIRKAYSEGHRKIMLFLATGGGKGPIFILLTESLLQKNKRVVLVMRRRQLIFQTQERFKKVGIDSSVIMGNEKGFDPNKKLQICSIDTVSRRDIEFMKSFDACIVDECFPKQTYIETDMGNITIGTLHKMRNLPKALSYNHEKKIWEHRQILNVFKNSKKSSLLNINFSISKLRCTENHEIATIDGYKKASEIQVGDAVIFSNNYLYLSKVKSEPENQLRCLPVLSVTKETIDPENMYDLEVEENHNYVVKHTREAMSGVLVHNCHDAVSEKYQEFLNFINVPLYIGLTASPFPIGKKVHDFWSCCVKPIEMEELKNQGYLVPCDLFVPPEVDLSQIKVQNGDYAQGELSKKMRELEVVGNVIDTYKEKGEDRPAIAFCVNKDHSVALCQEFNANGIPAIHCDESTPQRERDQAIQNLRNGKIKILCNVNIFSTGVDIPEAEVGIMARPTMSECLFIQQVGRLMRPYRKCGKCSSQYDNSPTCPVCGFDKPSYIKHRAIILDHGANTNRFGHPYDERFAALTKEDAEKSQKREKALIKTCTKCFYVYAASVSICPSCGESKTKERFFKTADGTLRPYDEFEVIKNFYQELELTQKIRGFKQNWKHFKLVEKFGDKAMKYEKEFGIPKFVPKLIKQQKEKGEIYK